MSNKEDEIFKEEYLKRPITFLTEENLDKLEIHCKKSIHFERGMEHQITLELIERYKEYLVKEQMYKKKIKELEEKNKILNCQNKQVENYAEELKKYNKTVSDRIVEYKKNSIPVQKVEDELEALRKKLKATMSGKLQEYTAEEIIIKINTLEELLEEEE